MEQQFIPTLPSMYDELERLETEVEHFEEHKFYYLYREVDRISEMLAALDYLIDDEDEQRRQKSKINTALTELRLHISVADISLF